MEIINIYTVLGYIILSYLSMIFLLIKWLKEIKEDYTYNKKFHRLEYINEIDQYKILWVFAIALSPFIIPFSILFWIYKKLKNETI